MLDGEDYEVAMNYLYTEELRYLWKRFDKTPKKNRLQAVHYTICIQLERYEQQNNEQKVAAFKGLKAFVERVKSVKEFEQLIAG